MNSYKNVTRLRCPKNGSDIRMCEKLSCMYDDTNMHKWCLRFFLWWAHGIQHELNQNQEEAYPKMAYGGDMANGGLS